MCVALFLGDLLEDGSDHAARSAPRSPEVDEHRLVGLDYLGLEVVVCDCVMSAIFTLLVSCSSLSVPILH